MSERAELELLVGASRRRTLVRADTDHCVRGCARLGFPGRSAVVSTHARVPLNSRPVGHPLRHNRRAMRKSTSLILEIAPHETASI